MIRDERQNGLNEGVVEARAGQLPHVAQVLPSYFPGGLHIPFLKVIERGDVARRRRLLVCYFNECTVSRGH